MSRIDDRLSDVGLQIRIASIPAANYIIGIQTGNLRFVSGKGPMVEDETALKETLESI